MVRTARRVCHCAQRTGPASLHALVESLIASNATVVPHWLARPNGRLPFPSLSGRALTTPERRRCTSRAAAAAE